MKCQRVFFPLFVVCLGFCFAADLVLASGADVVLTSISGPTKAFLNQTISVTYEVTNQGDVGSGTYQVGLYLSKDGTIDPANDRLLKEISFPGGLAAGQTKDDHQGDDPSGWFVWPLLLWGCRVEQQHRIGK